MRKSAIALLRVSSEAQAAADRQGLPAQRREVRRIAERHDLQIVDEVELHVSGTRVLDDPRFQELLSRIEKPDIHGVVVVDLDRLMRPDDAGYYSIFHRLRQTNTVLYTAAGPKDFRTDRIVMMVEAELAFLERERIAERTRRGREEKRRRGLRAEGLVGLPRGVAFDHATGRWGYSAPDAERVRVVFDLWLATDGTMSFREIALRSGLVSAQYSEPSGAVRRVLSQPLYAGIYRVDRRWVNGREFPREANEVHEHVVMDPPLVTSEEYSRAQELLAKKRSRHVPRRSHEAQGATYAGFLECAACGASMWVVPDSNGYLGYCCGSKRSKRCDTGQTSVRLAEPQIDAALEQRLGSEETLRRLVERSTDESVLKAARPASVARRINELHNQCERAKDAYEQGLYDVNELGKRLAKLKAQISGLEEALQLAGARIDIDADLVARLVDVFSSWRDLRRDEKRRLLKSFQIRVRVTRPARRVLSVDEVMVGVAGSQHALTIYKKLRRYGMQ
jgi:DNA invertase Pin-like site-specific DNA recombinase